MMNAPGTHLPLDTSARPRQMDNGAAGQDSCRLERRAAARSWQLGEVPHVGGAITHSGEMPQGNTSTSRGVAIQPGAGADRMGNQLEPQGSTS